MIEISYKRILVFQFLFLVLLAFINYFFFKNNFSISLNPSLFLSLFSIWIIFIILNLIFIKFYALPTKGLIEKLEPMATNEDLSWSDLESSLSRRDVDHKNQQTEYQIENLKFKLLLDSLHDPVLILNTDKIILFSNKAFNKLFSVKSLGEAASILEVTRNLEFLDFIQKSLYSTEVQKLQDFTFDNTQETFKKFFEIKAFPIQDIRNVLFSMQDVTERKMADLMREDFVANFSHEVRTPLTIVNGQLQLLRTSLEAQKYETSNFSQFFEKIDNNTRRLLNLFNDLLRLTSVEKKKEINKEIVNIAQLSESLVDELGLNYTDKRISFQFNFEVESLFIDYNLFEQVMINLIDNAYKYSVPNGVVQISTRQESGVHILEISDNGIGIPDDQLHRIFERFFRVDSSRSSEIVGTGLGLAIVKHIIQKHEGKIRALNHERGGTSFIITLPLS